MTDGTALAAWIAVGALVLGLLSSLRIKPAAGLTRRRRSPMLVGHEEVPWPISRHD